MRKQSSCLSWLRTSSRKQGSVRQLKRGWSDIRVTWLCWHVLRRRKISVLTSRNFSYELFMQSLQITTCPNWRLGWPAEIGTIHILKFILCSQVLLSTFWAVIASFLPSSHLISLLSFHTFLFSPLFSSSSSSSPPFLLFLLLLLLLLVFPLANGQNPF